MRAVGKASHGTLVGTRAGICDQNATRDVTAELSRSGMSMQVKKDSIVPYLMTSDGAFFLWYVYLANFSFLIEWDFTSEPQKVSQGPKVYLTKI